MNIFRLIADASLVVKIILLILVIFSVFSWAIIFFKRKTFKTASSQSLKFLEIFRRSRNLSEVNEAARKYQATPLSSIFQAGFKEMAYLVKSNPQNSSGIAKLENLNRAMVKASNAEISRLERLMPFLATTGSVTPFIGLFGTVWGIMDAFMRIGVTRSASLVSVAPGIAEALIATALGLFAAIPAVIAYNYFLHRIKDQITEMDDFSLELLTITERLYASP